MVATVAMFIFVFFMSVPMTRAAVPGTFFWKPRVGLDLSVPTSFPKVLKPTKENIGKGMVVLIDGYQAGLTVTAFITMLEVLEPYPHLNWGSAYYYTNLYRWTLRHLSIIPDWLGVTKRTTYVDTHKVWRKRFFYMEKFVPPWLRKILFFVSKDEWKKEEKEWKRFIKYAEPSFGKYYKYPSKKFNNYNSMRIRETLENLDITNASI